MKTSNSDEWEGADHNHDRTGREPQVGNLMENGRREMKKKTAFKVIMKLRSSHSEREGEALAAVLTEGAT